MMKIFNALIFFKIWMILWVVRIKAATAVFLEHTLGFFLKEIVTEEIFVLQKCEA